MNSITPILVSLFFISLISFVGAFTLYLNRKKLRSVLVTLTSFAAGALLAVTFFDLMPEAVEALGDNAFSLILIGLIIFFILERVIHWHHCHDEKCDFHAEHYLNIIGDGFHNFLDGGIIAAAYLADINLGIITTIAIAAHEIPQELGDFAILINGGFSPKKALLLNFLTALTAILGGLTVFYISQVFNAIAPILIAISAGGFIYISTADLLPAIAKEKNRKKILMHSLAFLIGIILLYLLLHFLGG